MSSKPLLRNRKHKAITTSKELQLEDHDDIFNCLGCGWELFKQGNYEKAFGHIYLSSKAGQIPASYLLGRIYEFGLVDTIDYKSACRIYTHVYAKSTISYLKLEAEKGIQRIMNRKISELN